MTLTKTAAPLKAQPAPKDAIAMLKAELGARMAARKDDLMDQAA